MSDCTQYNLSVLYIKRIKCVVSYTYNWGYDQYKICIHMYIVHVQQKSNQLATYVASMRVFLSKSDLTLITHQICM